MPPLTTGDGQIVSDWDDYWAHGDARDCGGEQMKTYRRHNCSRKHRTYAALAKCIWPKAAWVDGEGPYALVAWCGTPTVSLHETLESAEHDKKIIDYSACGGRCRGRHEIVLLLLPGESVR